MNLSNNKCDKISEIICSTASGTSDVSFSLFRKNIANNYWICNSFVSDKYELIKSNIIENEQTNTSCGTISTEGSSTTTLTISKCCFVENSGGSLFYADNPTKGNIKE